MSNGLGVSGLTHDLRNAIVLFDLSASRHAFDRGVSTEGRYGREKVNACGNFLVLWEDKRSRVGIETTTKKTRGRYSPRLRGSPIIIPI